MSSELAKTYDPAAVETEAYRVWIDEKCFSADPAAGGEPYSIVIPPPNVTGALHLGHAINNTLQDILTRIHRMRGFNTVWIPGIDHAGIATQAVVEKQLKEKENKTRHELGRDALVARIWEWKEQYGNRILEQLKRMGCSCDWDRTRFTLDDVCARAVRETFFKLFKDGLIYRGKRLVNWDVHLQTSISDDEIYHETVKTSLWYVKYPIAESSTGGSPVTDQRSTGGSPVTDQRSTGGSPVTDQRSTGGSPVTSDHGRTGHATHMVVATTRPETMLGDTAVAVNSQDPRWNWAIGKKVLLPLIGREIPIIADDILVDPKFGTGCVKVTPAHDPNDYAVWQRHKGASDEIDIINIINPNGTLNENAGPYKGLKREAARKKVVDDLAGHGLLVKEEPYETQIGHSDRSKTPIEPYLSDQWFVKMAPLAEPALEVVRQGIIKFYPERHAQQYLSWLGEKRDWPISRQLWWGHRIPVWTKLEQVASSPTRIDNIHVHKHGSTDVAVRTIIEGETCINYVCIPPGHADVETEFESQGYVQDPDVLDTWFSSALWPHSTLGWPGNTPELRKWYPTSVLVTARDIITLWVARMVMAGLYNMGHGQFTSENESEAQSKIENQKTEIESAVPFRHVAINPTILDGKGERMSKSKGNGVDPVEIIETHGADAMRFTLTSMATETQDARLPVKKLANGKNTSDKFDIGRNFCNKIWNATRFALQNLANIAPEPADAAKWSLADKWILSRLMRTLQEIDDAVANYRFDVYARTCYDFFWRDLCDWYIEIVKPLLKDDPRRGQIANVLAAALDAAMRIMHPMIPFITETIWWKLNEIRLDRALPGLKFTGSAHAFGPRLIRAPWPVFNDSLLDRQAEADFARLQEIIGAIRNLRNEHKVDQKKSVPVTISAPTDLADSLQSNRGTIELLATCQVKLNAAPPANAARVTVAGCDIFVEGLVDQNAEQQRLARRKDELTKQIAAMKARLANESYVAKAPPHLVAQTRQQLADAETEFAKL